MCIHITKMGGENYITLKTVTYIQLVTLRVRWNDKVVDPTKLGKTWQLS